MNCPGCMSSDTAVRKTLVIGSSVTRHRSCLDCASEWETRETVTYVAPRSPVAAGGQGAPPVAAGVGLFIGEPARAVSNVSSTRAHDSGIRDQNQIPPSPPKRGEEAPSADFLEFWRLYPRKVGKANAWRAWKRRSPSIDRVRTALAWQTKSAEWTKDGGQYVPNPATWLNQGRWDDEPLGSGPIPTGSQPRKLLVATPDLFGAKGGGDGIA